MPHDTEQARRNASACRSYALNRSTTKRQQGEIEASMYWERIWFWMRGAYERGEYNAIVSQFAEIIEGLREARAADSPESKA